MSKIEEGFKVDKSEYSKIYDTEDYLLVVPHTHTASCKYGANTRWCTTKRDDDEDFIEHKDMGVLAYLIIKNPEIYSEMSSQKYGLYRVHGYELKDLIVYDELNNEHLKGKLYLQNEFDKADREGDFFKVMNVYDQYFTQSTIIGGDLSMKPGKLEENISVDMIKDLCNRMVISKKGSFGNLPKTNIVYYTKGGKIVDIEKIKGDIGAPFKLGDSIHDLIRWSEENGVDTDVRPRNRRRIGEQEENNENTSITDPKLFDDPNLFNICVAILSGRLDEDDIDDVVAIHNKKYDEHLEEINLFGKQGDLVYKFEDTGEFCEYFSDNDENQYTLYEIGGSPDYEYYSDSVYQDTTEESYHWTQFKAPAQVKLADALVAAGFNVKDYDEERKSKILNSDYGWGSDELAYNIREIVEYHFPSYEEKLSEEYQEAAVTSYAEGFNQELNKDWESWLKGIEEIGMEEKEEFREYTVDVARLFRHLIRMSAARGSLKTLLEKNKGLYNSIGPGANIFSMSETRYEYQTDEPYQKLQLFINDFVNDLIENELTDNPLIDEMIREGKIVERFGLKSTSHLEYDFKKVVENRWSNKHIDATIEQLLQKGFPKENIFNIAGTENRGIYCGYNINDEGHVIYVKNEEESEDRWNYVPLKKMVVSVEQLVNMIKQTSLDLNEIIDLNEGFIKEQNREIMSTYYAMMSPLEKYYGEDNVKLIGEPAKIYIYKKNVVRWDGVDLFIKKDGGNEERIKVTEFKSSGSGYRGTTYPNIAYITNRIPVGAVTKAQQNTPKPKKKTEKLGDIKKYDSKFSDGTLMRASQTFWDNVKLDEGGVGTNGQPVLKAYKLGDGRVTIGWGHTGALSQPTPKVGQTITKQQAQQYLQKDATEAADCVRRMLREWKDAGLKSYMITQSMFDVLVSLAFNAGCQGLRSSKFIQLVKRGKHKEAAKLLPTDTTMINGKFSEGLTARRKREAQRYLE